MVLWEMTLATAYFLGLRRTYRLALKIQRKLISPKHPRIRQFAHRRTRDVFDVAVKVHRNIQDRDLEVGKNIGNRILRLLDRMKPSAEIIPKPSPSPSPGDSARTNVKKLFTNSTHQTTSSIQGNGVRTGNQESDRHFFASSRSIWQKSFPSVSMMMRSTTPARTNIQYRHLSIYGPQALTTNYREVVREDKMRWMLQN